MTNPKQDADWIDAIPLPALPEPVAKLHPNHIEPLRCIDGDGGEPWCREILLYSPHGQDDTAKTHAAIFTAEQMRDFARKAVAESEARRQGEAVAWSVTVGGRFDCCIEITHCESDARAQYHEVTKDGFESLYQIHPLYTRPQPLPAPSLEVAEYLADLIPNTAVVIEQDGKPIGVRMTYAEVKLFAQALATTPPAPANSEAIPAPVAPECRMLTKEEVFSVVRDSFVAKLSHYECLQLKFCEVNGLKLAANGGAKI
jgi:hypothetical protein